MTNLPVGWRTVLLDEICARVPNFDPTRTPNKQYEYVDIGAIDNVRGQIAWPKTFAGKDAPSRARRPIQRDDVLFSNVRTYLRNVARVTNGVTAGLCSTGFTVLRPTKLLDSSYLYHYVRSDGFITAVTPKQTGTHYPATSDRVVLRQTIPLPPTTREQQRIAEKLDEIALRLESTNAHLESVAGILQRFRLSVLAVVMSGKLTEEWRRKRDSYPSVKDLVEAIKNRRLEAATTTKQRKDIETQFASLEERDSDQLPASWRFIALGKLASFHYGTAKKSRAQGRVPVLRMGNLQNGEIDWNDLAFTSDRGEIEKYKLAPMTVLFNRTNSPELVGKTAIYRGERPAIFAGYLIRVNHEQELLPEYLNYCLNSADARAWCRAVKTDGVSQSNINAQKLAKYEIPFCPLEEQQEVVRRAGVLFRRAKAIEIRYRKALAYTSRLMPAAIEKAYRGELLAVP
jgi:type I restriction enzyme S subunit